MPRDTAQTRLQAGRLDATTVTIDRPETQIRSPSGDTFTLPRQPSDTGVVIYRKVNGRIVDPKTGDRLKRGNGGFPSKTRPQTVSFGAVALTAYIGLRVAQLLRRAFRQQSRPSQQEQQLLLQQQLQEEQQQLPPPLRVFPAMLQRALPQLGPPSRVKRLAQAHKTKQRRIPSAQQKMQTSGVAHRRPLTLEKWDRAIRQQAQALMVGDQSLGATGAQQLECSRNAAALLPLPGLLGTGALPPQPLLEVADVPYQ